jgi:radical SAM protein with 4Fe4S-binding SPASM domain
MAKAFMGIRYRHLSSPTQVQVEITERCNRACLYCANDWRGEAPQRSPIDHDRIEMIARRLSEAHVFECVVTGGEPLICRDDTMFLSERLMRDGISVSINTNASLVDDVFAAWVSRKAIPVYTSVMSYREDMFDALAGRPGEFIRSVRGIEKMASHGARVQANMVVCKKNIDDVYETCRFSLGIGAQSFSATRVCPSPIASWDPGLLLDKADVHSLFSQLREAEFDFGVNVASSTSYPLCGLDRSNDDYAAQHQLSCSAGRLMCVVSPEGNVKPCGFVSEEYGNIFEEPLSEIWARFAPWRDGSLIPGVCQTCRLLPDCGGGCRASGLRSGRADGCDPIADLDIAQSDDFQASKRQALSLDKLSMTMKFRRSSGAIRLRDEDFGAIVFGPVKFPLMLTHDGVTLLKLLENDSLSGNEIIAATGQKDCDVRGFIYQAFRAGLLVRAVP